MCKFHEVLLYSLQKVMYTEAKIRKMEDLYSQPWQATRMRTELMGHKSLVIMANAKAITARRNTEDQVSGKRGGALGKAPFIPGHQSC